MNKFTKTLRIALAVAGIGTLATGCIKNKDNTPLPDVSGKYAGKYIMIVKKSNSFGYDTVKSDVNLILKTDSGYAISGDTLGVHANSHGKFAYNFLYMEFRDDTYTESSSKLHLAGLYEYYYDGSTLKIGGSYKDSLKVTYDFKKASK